MTGRSVEVNTVLVPVDGSEESVTALEFAAAIAEKYDAVIHAVYVLGEQVVRAIETGAVDEDEVVADTRSFIDTAADIAGEYGVSFTNSTAYGFSTTRKTQHPGSVILDCAEEIDADFLVIPRESLTDDPGEILEKAAEYVLLYASQPVLSV